MGFFSKRRKAAESNAEIARMRAEMAADNARFNEIMDRVNSAYTACKESQDKANLDEYANAIQYAKANNINLSNAHDFRLVNFYIKAGMNNTAWGYLNGMIFDNLDDLDKIRKEQVRICKKEGRWTTALQYLIMQHACKENFNRDAFMKDLKPIANKIPLIDDEAEYLTDQISQLRGIQMQRDSAAGELFDSFFKERLADRSS